MDVDLRTPPSHPVADVVAFAQECEEAGFSGCGFNDAQAFYRDTYVVMAQVLANTTRLRVHPAVTCPGPRHTSLVASSAKTVQEFGPDRFELWLGRGSAAPKMVGIPILTVKEMRDSVVKIKRFMAGEWDVYTPVQTSSKHVHMHHSGGQPIPIYMAASGPMMLRMAGELADGVLFGGTVTRAGIERAKGLIGEGAARVGKDPSTIRQVLSMRCIIRETRREAVRTWSPQLLRVLAKEDASEWLQKRGIPFDIVPYKERFLDAEHELGKLYPDPHHYQDQEAAMRIASVIPEDLQEVAGDTMAVLGDPDQVAQRILELESWGVNHVYLYPIDIYNLPRFEVKAYREVIGPALKKSAEALTVSA